MVRRAFDDHVASGVTYLIVDWPSEGRGRLDEFIAHRQHVAALSGLSSTLGPEQLATSVPGTPAWAVHDVFAHLAGVASDAVDQRVPQLFSALVDPGKKAELILSGLHPPGVLSEISFKSPLGQPNSKGHIRISF